MVEYMPETLPLSTVSVPTIATAINEAIIAYSIAVAPCVSALKARMKETICLFPDMTGTTRLSCDSPH